jgi:large subunit ribosomal protein L4
MKLAALRSALSDRAANGRVHVIDSLVEGAIPSTKGAISTLKSLTDRSRVLVVLDRTDNVSWLSLRNLPKVHILVPDQMNTYDVMVADDVVFTTNSLKIFLDQVKARSGKAVARESEIDGNA